MPPSERAWEPVLLFRRPIAETAEAAPTLPSEWAWKPVLLFRRPIAETAAAAPMPPLVRA